MSSYLKGFIYASLVYLGLAAVFGILVGTVDIGYFGHFAHTHFNLLGFMSMMICGIGYFILPRFNASEIKYPGWIPVHFWLGNISLVGMVFFRGMVISTGSDIYQVLFIIMAAIQVITLFMFILNIWITLSPSKEKETPFAIQPLTSKRPGTDIKTPDPDINVTADSKIAELIDTCAAVRNYLVNNGLPVLEQPGHVDRIREMGITLGMAADKHDFDIDKLIYDIKELIGGNAVAPADTDEKTQVTGQSSEVSITLDNVIGQIIRDYPQTRPLFQKYFGGACLDCPGQAFESIELACRMHGVNAQSFLQELQSTIERPTG